MSIAIRPLVATDAASCDAIILSLPDFFGHEGGRADCAQAVRTQRGCVAEHAGAVVGFATWERRTASTAEITWMAVLRDRRHRGIGTAIVEALAVELRAQGYRLALAMTSGRPKHEATPDTYEPTRAFWAARGFLPLIELDIWDTDVALLQVRVLR